MTRDEILKMGLNQIAYQIDRLEDALAKEVAAKEEALARLETIRAGLRRLIDEGVDTSTSGGMDYVRFLLIES